MVYGFEIPMSRVRIYKNPAKGRSIDALSMRLEYGSNVY
jgi:hypothetical protein